MRTAFLAMGAAIAALAVSAGGASAQGAPQLITDGGESSSAQLVFGRDILGADPLLQKAQFLFSGRNYCWYDGGWHGPGFYWCGYAYRRGFGWGGPVGWHGFSRGYGGFHGGGFHGGGNYGGGGFHGGGRGGGVHVNNSVHVGGNFHGGGGHAGGGHAGGGGHSGGGGHGGGGGGHHH